MLLLNVENSFVYIQVEGKKSKKATTNYWYILLKYIYNIILYV